MKRLPTLLALPATSALAAVLALTGAAPAALAQPQSEELPRIRISDPNRELFRLALPNVVGDGALAGEALETQRRDFSTVGLFKLVDPTSFPPELQREGTSFSAALWSQVGAQGVSKVSVARQGGKVTLTGNLYQVGRGDNAVLSKSYSGEEVRPLVHRWANDVIEQLTGQRGVFGSRIAFALGGRGPQEIATIDANGSDLRTVTSLRAENQMPAFSPRGDQIAFTSFIAGGPEIWLVPAGGGRARRLSRQPGLNTGATFGPNGQLVLTLSFQGNAELYRISPTDGKVMARLTNNSALDLSATFSPDGSQIAFVSSRQGTPQIYVMPATGSPSAKRLTFQGNYNQTPRWNPNPAKPLIAFTGRDERGVFDVFTYDIRGGKVERRTQNAGSNQSPAWSPDGRLLVYTSTRGGLYVQNIETGQELQIWKGNAQSPDWGPVTK